MSDLTQLAKDLEAERAKIKNKDLAEIVRRSHEAALAIIDEAATDFEKAYRALPPSMRASLLRNIDTLWPDPL